MLFIRTPCIFDTQSMDRPSLANRAPTVSSIDPFVQNEDEGSITTRRRMITRLLVTGCLILGGCGGILEVFCR